MAYATSLSSVGSATLVLNPVARSTTVLVNMTAVSTGTLTIDASVDDPSIPGGATSIWASISSGVSMTSSVVALTGLVYTVLTPVAQVRVTSTANNGTINLRALQSVTA